MLNMNSMPQHLQRASPLLRYPIFILQLSPALARCAAHYTAVQMKQRWILSNNLKHRMQLKRALKKCWRIKKELWDSVIAFIKFLIHDLILFKNGRINYQNTQKTVIFTRYLNASKK